MANNLMPKKVKVNPFARLLSSLLKAHQSTIKLSRFLQVIDGNSQMKRR
jgi:hypothetical protein